MVPAPAVEMELPARGTHLQAILDINYNAGVSILSSPSRVPLLLAEEEVGGNRAVVLGHDIDIEDGEMETIHTLVPREGAVDVFGGDHARDFFGSRPGTADLFDHEWELALQDSGARRGGSVRMSGVQNSTATFTNTINSNTVAAINDNNCTRNSSSFTIAAPPVTGSPVRSSLHRQRMNSNGSNNSGSTRAMTAPAGSPPRPRPPLQINLNNNSNSQQRRR